MSANALLQFTAYVGALLLLAKPLGEYMALVYGDRPTALDRLFAPAEKILFKLAGVDPDRDMDWRSYAVSAVMFGVVGMLAVFGLLRLQNVLPLNPDGMPAVAPDLAFNTAVSFATNTNWQAYGGESTMSYLSQALGLTVQNFLSAATGMAVLVALARGFARREADGVGNFWRDMTRSVTRILLPLSFALAFVLVWQGVPQTFGPAMEIESLEGVKSTIALGPVASQVAIRQLGTNGGGFYNTNSAHPLENPTPLSNFLQMLAILALPAALCVTFGRLIGDERQGWALLFVMTALFAIFTLGCVWAESQTPPSLAAAGAVGGAMEGKEVRFGVASSAIWAAATTAASNGSVNAMHGSFTPLGGMAPMLLMQLGEVVFGGVGSGLYGMILFAVIAVFLAGLMVGRTPEYLGKKIEAFETQMAALVILIPCLLVLFATALAVLVPSAREAVANPGPRGFSEILYSFSSMGNNNGSAFAGLSANQPFYNLVGGLVMFISRFWIIIPALAVAGSLARKKSVPAGPGTLSTHTPLFGILLASVVLLVGALTFIPALALGPIVEQLQYLR